MNFWLLNGVIHLLVDCVDVELRLDSGGCPVKFNDKLLDFSVISSIKPSDRRFTPSDTQNSIAGQLLLQLDCHSGSR